ANELERELAAICTRVTASPQPEEPRKWGEGVDWSNDGGATWHPIESGPPQRWTDDTIIRPRPSKIADIKQAIDEKLLVYGDGLIDKGAMYRDVLREPEE